MLSLALEAKRVSRIILGAAAWEAGEGLGILPGTLQEKVDPYLRPLYDTRSTTCWTGQGDNLLEAECDRGGRRWRSCAAGGRCRRVHHPGRGAEHDDRAG